MSDYKRFYLNGGCYFFTVVTYKRQQILTQANNAELLKQALNHVKKTHLFFLHAMVILPNHFHCLLKQPEKDFDYSTRIRLIKSHFSKAINLSFNEHLKKPVWQQRFWEHYIRHETDWKKHMDYIHYNPVKHGYVKAARDWPHSTFHAWVERGVYDFNWGSSAPESIKQLRLE